MYVCVYIRFIPTDRTQLVKNVKILLKLHEMSINTAIQQSYDKIIIHET